MQQLLIPFLIFLARIIDVTLQTLRIILVARGMRYIAPIIGFFEVLTWIIVVSTIIKNYPGLINYIAYAAGFGMGNFVGIAIEEKLSMGNALVRIVTKSDAGELTAALRRRQYGITSIDAQGAEGNVKIIFTVVRRKKVRDIIDVVRQCNPRAFYTVEDIRFVTERNLFPYVPTGKNGLQRFHSVLTKKK